MRSLSVDDMRRVLGRGESFLLVDVRPLEVTTARSIPYAVRLPFGRGIAEMVREGAGPLTQPIVVCGDGENCPIAERTAEQLEQAGYQEVWTYCGDPQAWVRITPASKPASMQVVSDPDLG